MAFEHLGHQLDLAEDEVGVAFGLTLRHDLEEAAAGVDHRACARPISSSAEAKVPGTYSPSRSLWFSEREVEKPTAPAPIASRTWSRHLRDVVGGGVLVARAALAHDVHAQRRVRQEGGDVHRVLAAVERVEVLGEGLPLPLDALVQRGAGDVLDALHQLDEAFLPAGAHRGEADAAVAGDDGGDTVAGRRVEDRVPGGLTVVVRVDVDEPGRDEQPGGVDDLGRVAVDVLADLDDHAALDRHIAHEAGAAGAVDDGSPGDLQIEHAPNVPRLRRCDTVQNDRTEPEGRMARARRSKVDDSAARTVPLDAADD